MERDQKLRIGVKSGGLFLVIAAALLFGWSLLSLLAGSPPSQAEGIPHWIDTGRLFIALSNESLSFATFALLFGAVGLSFQLWFFSKHPLLAIVSASAILLSVVNLSLMNVFLGRLVYPVYGWLPGTESLVLSLSSYYGALHMFDLVWAVVVVLIGVSFYRERKALWLLIVSVMVAISELVVAYPWVFSAEAVFALRVPLQAWLALVGVLLIQHLKKGEKEADV